MRHLGSPGLQLVAIGVLHNLVGLVLGSEPLLALAQDGWFGQVEGSMDRVAIFWFLWFGWMLMLLGGAVRALEPGRVPTALTAGIAAMILGGCATIPVSGFWLGLIPVAGLVRSRA
ncbi:MAG: DUF6463 family protein [Myxococcota bacterium]